MTQEQNPEFSRKLAVDELDPGGAIRRSIEPTPEERAALAQRMDLLGLDAMAAEVTLRRVPGGPVIRATGRLTADVVQRCVVTLTAVEGRVDQEFDELFAPEGYEPPEEEGDGDLPDSFDGKFIDVGELAAQVLALGLDPYPRKEGAPLPSDEDEGDSVSDSRRPFEGLAEMLRNRH